MTSVNFIGIPLFILFVLCLLLIITGIFTRRPRLWKPALWVMAAVAVSYLILFFVFR